MSAKKPEYTITFAANTSKELDEMILRQADEIRHRRDKERHERKVKFLRELSAGGGGK